MNVFLVRHAHAGQRSQDGRDIYRPLSPEGHIRAEELTSIFADRQVTKLMASPATRCLQTLGPLAHAAGLPVEECQALWEGSGIDEALSALETAGSPTVVACSHGDIIPGLIEALGAKGVSIKGRGCELGSIWILDFEDGCWTRATYGGIGNDRLETSA